MAKRDVLHTVNSIYDPLELIEPLRNFGSTYTIWQNYFYPNLVQAVWFCLEKDALTFTLTKKRNRDEARCFAHS